MYPHLILGQCTRLICTDYGNGAHGLTCMHLTNQVIGFQHTTHIDRQRQRYAHRQPFGHRYNNQRHRHHEVLQHPFGNGQPIRLKQIFHQSPFHQQGNKGQYCQ